MQTQPQAGQSRHRTQPPRKQSGPRKDSEPRVRAEPAPVAQAPRKGPRFGCGF